ncbi:MAG: hypothetical protein ACRDJ9_24335, partial [Dehalococcoidia bacterium]
RGRNSGPGLVVLASVVVLASLTLLLSALWLPGADRLVESAAQSALQAGRQWELPLSIALVVLAGALVWRLLRRDLLLRFGLPVALQARVGDWLGLPTAIEAFLVRPVVALSRTLAQLDDRVIDAGVRGVAWSARRVSSLFALRGEWTFDGAVRALSALTLSTAEGSRATDDRVVDAAVEGGAQAVAVAGQTSRRLQTGQAHHYYVMLAAGLIVMLAILVVPR